MKPKIGLISDLFEGTSLDLGIQKWDPTCSQPFLHGKSYPRNNLSKKLQERSERK